MMSAYTIDDVNVYRSTTFDYAVTELLAKFDTYMTGTQYAGCGSTMHATRTFVIRVSNNKALLSITPPMAPFTNMV